MSTRSAFLAAGVAIAAAIFLLRPASDLSRDLGEAVADMILANATIYTADPAMPFAEAMAVRAGRVLRVGGYDSVKHYKDDPRSYGLQLVDMDYLLNTTLELDKSGLQIAIHAIGDKANDMLLDMYEKVVDLNGMKDHRFRIEHAQHLAPGAAKRFGKHGIIASVQVKHTISAAYACFLDHVLGSLSEGKYADFVILPCTSWDEFASDIPDHVLATYVNGKAGLSMIPLGDRLTVL
uniref:Amidohydrolase 3 domain-containing protein n=1 Tax=Oryza meridionalis TaxID=40149 RepID=A0A0E0CD19_9ORYZ